MNSNASTKQAFTLIELLVVVAIIGILSSIVLASLSNAKDKALNSSKKQTIKQYQKALALYYASYGEYPNENLDSSFQVCLGKDYPNNSCAGFGKELTSTSANDNPNVALEEFISGRPKPKDSLPDEISGLSYECKDGVCDNYYLYWYIEASDCSFGEFHSPYEDFVRCKIDQGN